MNITNVAVGVTYGILTVLLILTVFMEKPEKALYDQTIETLMHQEGLPSEQETINCFPELQDIETKMERMAILSRNIHSLTGGPAPNVSKQESQQIQAFTHEIQQLRKSINQKLVQLLVTYAQEHNKVLPKFIKPAL